MSTSKLSSLFRRLMDEVDEAGSDLPGGEPQSDDSANKWNEFLAEDEPDQPFEAEPAEAPPADVPETPEPPAEPTPPAVPAESIQEPAPAPEPQVQPISPEKLAEYREGFRTTLEQTYAFNEDDALALQTEPEKVLPKLAARLHMEVLDNVSQLINNVVPNLIQSVSRGSAREEKAQSEFFGAWPELRGHDEQVLQMGAMYRKMNPKAPPEEAIQRIGELTMVALGKKRAEATPNQPPEPPARPFRPAAPGTVSAPLPVKNKWEALMDDDE